MAAFEKIVCVFELSNALSVLVPFCVTLWCIADSGVTFARLCVLVGWSMHVPCAVAYHLLTAWGNDNDIMMRMDKTLQLSAAASNFLAQTGDVYLSLLFVCLCVRFACLSGLWDLHQTLANDNKSLIRTQMMTAAAVLASCLPMVYNNHVTEFSIATGAFLSGGAMLLSEHPLAYTPFHVLLGVFAWALVVELV